ncbi:MAG: lysozyme inhibitor LprI family protein, partial [Chthoniobacteraceae bacterium]|nr:lysozyme inhibitor LprI family protein [Chthoniobacteraceae bacterium]
MSTKHLFHFLFVAAMSASMCPTTSHGALSSSQSEALYQQMLKDPEFKAADKELSSVYTQVRQGLDAAAQLQLRDQQRQWLKMKDDALSQSEPGKRTQLALRLTLERIRELRGQAQAGARGTAPVE